MILSHEIPQGCKLYFGKDAKVKRELESLASAILYQNGYEEIITPTFAYLEHQRDIHSREVCAPITNSIIKLLFATIPRLIQFVFLLHICAKLRLANVGFISNPSLFIPQLKCIKLV